ncbi:hypothetical protein HAX54_002185, partial [Datura stramonium]|nr:hypothetical protein [Datura stramonium]
MSLMVGMMAIRKVMDYRGQYKGLMVRVTAYQHSDVPSRVPRVEPTCPGGDD